MSWSISLPSPLSNPAPFLLGLALVLVGLSPAAAGGSEIATIRRLMDDPSPSARAAALRRLAGDSSPAALSLLRERLDDPHPYVRRACAGVLGLLLDPVARTRLLRRLRKERAPRPRAEACRIFALWADETGRAELQRALADRAPLVRLAAVRWLSRLLAAQPPGAAAEAVGTGADPWAAIEARSTDEDPAVAAEALSRLPPARPGTRRAERIRKAWGHPDPRVRMAALEGSVAVAGEAAVFAVPRGLADAVWSVRLAAAELAGAAEHARSLSDRRVVAALIPALEDERLVVRDVAHAALVRLTGIPFEAERARWQAWLETDGPSFDFGARADAPAPRFQTRRETVAGPRFYGIPIASRRIAFVLDASGSMRDPTPTGLSRWDVVCREVGAVLARLRTRAGTRVNLHLFADEVVSLYDEAVSLTAARVTGIGKRLTSHRPRGRTALYDGIAAALSDEDIDTVVVLSDGAPSAGSYFTKTDLLEEIARCNRWRRARIHVIAVGRGGIAKRWRTLLETIASQHGGTYVERD